mmetsp:Transcript_45559/g.114821  ORF Transcript_45559/g.114821 Transcript_45559/m.114821 type:complete len:217 (+) Transcript_45559:343-993(+)
MARWPRERQAEEARSEQRADQVAQRQRCVDFRDGGLGPRSTRRSDRRRDARGCRERDLRSRSRRLSRPQSLRGARASANEHPLHAGERAQEVRAGGYLPEHERIRCHRSAPHQREVPRGVLELGALLGHLALDGGGWRQLRVGEGGARIAAGGEPAAEHVAVPAGEGGERVRDARREGLRQDAGDVPGGGVHAGALHLGVLMPLQPRGEVELQRGW